MSSTIAKQLAFGIDRQNAERELQSNRERFASSPRHRRSASGSATFLGNLDWTAA